MPLESVTEKLISKLKSCPKYVVNPDSPFRVGGGITRCIFDVAAVGGGNLFELYLRDNRNSLKRSNFSCGLIWVSPATERLTLCRYNGDSHCHVNLLEKEEIVHQYHIHLATERYITAGLKPEAYAVPCNAYTTLAGALKCLADDWHITGLPE